MTSEKSYDNAERIDALWAALADPDTWHSLGSLSGFTVNRGRYRLNRDGRVHFDIDVTGGGSEGASTPFANALPSDRWPTIDRDYPLACDTSVSSTQNWPHVHVNHTNGNVSIQIWASSVARFSNEFDMSLD